MSDQPSAEKCACKSVAANWKNLLKLSTTRRLSYNAYSTSEHTLIRSKCDMQTREWDHTYCASSTASVTLCDGESGEMPTTTYECRRSPSSTSGSNLDPTQPPSLRD